MLYREIIAVYSQIHTKHINTLCGQNAVSLFGYNWQYEQFKIRASTWTAELNDKSSATYPKDQLLFIDARKWWANKCLHLLSLFQALSCCLIYTHSGSWSAFPVSFSNNEVSTGDRRTKKGLITRDWKYSERPVLRRPVQEDCMLHASDGQHCGHPNLLTYLLTYSMQHSPSWEANWFCS